jgi:hypothetical protein
MLTNKNTILITTTIPNNNISEKRRNNIINNFKDYNIPILFNDYIKKNYSINQISYEMIVNNINLFKQTNFDYAIICDDDFNPINNFMEELNNTISLLPIDWRCFHICPGYLWGRKFRDQNKIGSLNCEYNMNNIPFHDSGRYYMNCNSNIYFKNNFWLGGPIAFVINKNNVDSLLNDFINKYNKKKNPNDVILAQILNVHDFISRSPMLGYENEQGGTTFNS